MSDIFEESSQEQPQSQEQLQAALDVNGNEAQVSSTSIYKQIHRFNSIRIFLEWNNQKESSKTKAFQAAELSKEKMVVEEKSKPEVQ